MRRTLVAALFVAAVALAYSADMPSSAPAPAVPGTGFYIDVNPKIGGHLFSWFFPSQDNSLGDDTPFIRMTGGPGCSGQLAALFENGPYAVDEHLNLVPNPYSWNLKNHIMFIDQPYGAGFSYVDSPNDYLDNETEVSDVVYQYLLDYFSGPGAQYANNPFYVSGESYGGHYVPAVSARILAGNGKNTQQINFQGLSIGNGMVDPIAQFPGYYAYAKEYNLVDGMVLDAVEDRTKKCEALLAANNLEAGFTECMPIIDDILEASGINPYDRLLKCPPAFPLCYNLTAQTDYLNLPYVQAALGVDRTWAPCNDAVNARFTTDWVTSFAFDLAAVLNAGKTALIYYGELDFICNGMGGALTFTNSNFASLWPEASIFNALQQDDWYIGSLLAGNAKSHGGLSLVNVANAGHMVPHDCPICALALIENLTAGVPLNTTTTTMRR